MDVSLPSLCMVFGPTVVHHMLGQWSSCMVMWLFENLMETWWSTIAWTPQIRFPSFDKQGRTTWCTSSVQISHYRPPSSIPQSDFKLLIGMYSSNHFRTPFFNHGWKVGSWDFLQYQWIINDSSPCHALKCLDVWEPKHHVQAFSPMVIFTWFHWWRLAGQEKALVVKNPRDAWRSSFSLNIWVHGWYPNIMTWVVLCHVWRISCALAAYTGDYGDL